ncbi:Na/Pi cotransporter family protein [bacterium]|nr:Na/Pi cotransporter family protein [bacterium]
MVDTLWQFLSFLSQLLGGVGLFLSGMILMSDGLKAAAGSRLQQVLERSTGTPPAAFLSGVALTALIQSSSATTITTIGFVSAGLLSFASAIGVIIGANVGTTSTGWIVALLGFKLNVGAIALPFVGVGALMRLLGNGLRAQLGMALVGFGLIFIGIDFLQDGMSGVAQNIDLSSFAQPTLLNYIVLALIGAAMTVLLQSSSAAVALTLTALYSGAIGLEQAAYLVIGQNLGTTVKAMLAAAGASTSAKRTAVAHILFNVAIGILAFLFVSQLLNLSEMTASRLDADEPAVVLAIFHTFFNLIGAFLFLPFIPRFARLIEQLVPERGPHLTRHLDRSLLHVPDVAVEAAARALKEILAVTLAEASTLLREGQSKPNRVRLASAQVAMDETSHFLGQIQLGGYGDASYARRLALLHAGDHVDRLLEACLEPHHLRSVDEIEAAVLVADTLAQSLEWVKAGESAPALLVEQLAQTSMQQAERRRHQRVVVLEETAAGLMPPEQAQQQLDSMRWIDRIAYHTWRSLHHLSGLTTAADTLDSSVYAGAGTADRV